MYFVLLFFFFFPIFFLAAWSHVIRPDCQILSENETLPVLTRVVGSQEREPRAWETEKPENEESQIFIFFLIKRFLNYYCCF